MLKRSKFYQSFVFSLVELSVRLIIALTARFKLLLLSILCFGLVSLSFVIQLQSSVQNNPVSLDFSYKHAVWLNQSQCHALLKSWQKINYLQPHSEVIKQQLKILESHFNSQAMK